MPPPFQALVPPGLRACAAPVRLLLLSEGLGLMAGGLAQVGIGWWVAQRGGAADLTRYGGLTALCSLLAMPLLSPWGDRSRSKRRLVRLGRLCLLLDAAVLAWLAGSGVYHLGLVCAASVLTLLAQAVLLPTETSLLPELVPAEQLPQAIRLRRGAQALGGLLGPGLAGAALAWHGEAAAMLLYAAVSLVAAGAAFGLPEPRFPARRAAAAGWFGDLEAGFRAKWGVPLERWWSLTGALMLLFLLPATGLLLPLRIQALGLSAAWFGACTAALSCGVLIGVAGLADRLTARWGRLHAMYAAVLACGLAIGAVGLCPWAPGLVLLFGLTGVCLSVTQLVGQTHRLLAVPEDFRARMAAASFTVAQLAAAAAPWLAGRLLLRWPVQAVYPLLAAGFLLSGLLLLAVPGLPRFLRLDPPRVKDWYRLHHPQAFARRGAAAASSVPPAPS